MCSDSIQLDSFSVTSDTASALRFGRTGTGPSSAAFDVSRDGATVSVGPGSSSLTLGSADAGALTTFRAPTRFLQSLTYAGLQASSAGVSRVADVLQPVGRNSTDIAFDAQYAVVLVQAGTGGLRIGSYPSQRISVGGLLRVQGTRLFLGLATADHTTYAAPATSGAGVPWALRGQNAVGTAFDGGNLVIDGGTGSTGGGSGQVRIGTTTPSTVYIGKPAPTPSPASPVPPYTGGGTPSLTLASSSVTSSASVQLTGDPTKNWTAIRPTTLTQAATGLPATAVGADSLGAMVVACVGGLELDGGTGGAGGGTVYVGQNTPAMQIGSSTRTGTTTNILGAQIDIGDATSDVVVGGRQLVASTTDKIVFSGATLDFQPTMAMNLNVASLNLAGGMAVQLGGQSVRLFGQTLNINSTFPLTPSSSSALTLSGQRLVTTATTSIAYDAPLVQVSGTTSATLRAPAVNLTSATGSVTIGSPTSPTTISPTSVLSLSPSNLLLAATGVLNLTVRYARSGLPRSFHLGFLFFSADFSPAPACRVVTTCR